VIGLKQTESRISILASRHKEVYTNLPLLGPLRASCPSFGDPVHPVRERRLKLESMEPPAAIRIGGEMIRKTIVI
jgi:hypothetical protein